MMTKTTHPRDVNPAGIQGLNIKAVGRRWIFAALALFFAYFPATSLQAQDPFFTHFYANESEFNPAMTGYRGALSFGAKYKNQWAGANVRAFQSGLFTFEESMPCSIFDYGFALKFDEEGDGRLRTYDTGLKLAGTIGGDIVDKSRNATRVWNLRMGLALRWAYKVVDFSRFTFSDEIDPKYGFFDAFGNDLPTSFNPPNEGRSNLFFAPGVGIVFDFLSNDKSRRPWTLTSGLAFHNIYSFGGSRYGNEESLLGIGTPLPERLSFFLELEWILSNNARQFTSLTPLFFYQRQGEFSQGLTGLHYYEVGASFGLNSLLSLGLLYHASQRPQSGSNDHWFSLNAEFGGIISTKGTKDRVDLGISYSSNFTGLKNTVGPILEISLRYQLAVSPACGWMGKDDEVPYNNGVNCPRQAFSRKRRKMYENIWSNLYNGK